MAVLTSPSYKQKHCIEFRQNYSPIRPHYSIYLPIVQIGSRRLERLFRLLLLQHNHHLQVMLGITSNSLFILLATTEDDEIADGERLPVVPQDYLTGSLYPFAMMESLLFTYCSGIWGIRQLDSQLNFVYGLPPETGDYAVGLTLAISSSLHVRNRRMFWVTMPRLIEESKREGWASSSFFVDGTYGRCKGGNASNERPNNCGLYIECVFWVSEHL